MSTSYTRQIIPLGIQGLDEKTDPKALSPTQGLTVVRNGVYTRQGTIRKRAGSVLFSDQIHRVGLGPDGPAHVGGAGARKQAGRARRLRRSVDPQP